MKLFFDDPSFDGQLQRSVGNAESGMANVGECLAIAEKIQPGDRDAWHSAWSSFAERLATRADEARAAGHRVSARGSYLRTSRRVWRAAARGDGRGSRPVRPRISGARAIRPAGGACAGSRPDPEFDAPLDNPATRATLAPRMTTHGVTGVREYLVDLMRYTSADTIGAVSCPTFVTDNETDLVSTGQGKVLFEHLDCPKEFRLFTKAEGAEGHCEGMAPVVFWDAAFDWLDSLA